MRVATSLRRIVPLFLLLTACGARVSDPPAPPKRDVDLTTEQATLNGSSYTCTPSGPGGPKSCVCNEISTFDCWNMEFFECCPNIKDEPFCGDEICGADGKKCKCTSVNKAGPVQPPGTCSGRCGGYDPSKTCQCDTACASFQDCCRDRGATCLPARKSTCTCRFDCGFGGAAPCCTWC
jgi:hypothetical protein